MRHSKRRHILGVSSSHRSAMLGNLSVALITHGRIKTTLAKAKALRPFIEKIITLAKKADQANDGARKLHFRRLAISRVRDKKAVAELFDNKVSEFSNRAGGYTRIYKLGQRVGDVFPGYGHIGAGGLIKGQCRAALHNRCCPVYDASAVGGTEGCDIGDDGAVGQWRVHANNKLHRARLAGCKRGEIPGHDAAVFNAAATGGCESGIGGHGILQHNIRGVVITVIAEG